jgi:hypothetical protein
MAQGLSVELALTGGAGRSTGAGYALDGRIAGFYPGRLSGGSYVLESDMFGKTGPVIPAEVELLASYSNGQLTIFWDRAAATFLLESTASLTGDEPWTAVGGQVQSNATHFFVSIPVSGEHQFFRLRQR